MITPDLGNSITPCVMPQGKCLAGFSGGADSTAMMYLLAEQRDKGRVQPEAIHVNHGLRGDESDEDEFFCRRLCEKLEIPFHSAHADLKGKKDENSCREERFRIFDHMMETTGIRSLVLAHNQDDLAETFLMRLMRGAGTEGLACMSSVDPRKDYTIYRPLLRTSRSDIRQALQNAGIYWRDDSLNNSDVYLRNRIREQLIPLMDEMTGGIVPRIARSAEILNGENRVLRQQAEEYVAKYSNGRRIQTNRLKEMPEALRNRILRAWWCINAPELCERVLNSRQTKELSELSLSERGKINLPGGHFAVKGKNILHLTGFPKEKLKEIRYTAESIRFGKTILSTLRSEGNPGDGILTQEFPSEMLHECVIRSRKPGDRIRPFGMKGCRKLQDYFTDRGIDEPWRDDIPLLCRGNEVLMAAGVGCGAVPMWSDEANNVRLKWSGDLPWITEEREADIR